MNTKVSGMVDALFENVVWSDEVKALHDELMDNCQAHYEDLLHDGKSEEEALAAVKESLSGIDEIIQKYARKKKTIPSTMTLNILRRRAWRLTARRKRETVKTLPNTTILAIPCRKWRP